MARDTLTGSRIRERRTMAGMRQTELAQAAGISASYLNLIEHNRRRIGGKLLIDIAQALDVEPSVLSEGAGAALIEALREAAGARGDATAEVDRIDEFAGRFPGWAELVAENAKRITHLQHTVETLTDRLAHDPHLAESMHEVLTMVTAIHSTAGILADTKELEPEWRNRFQRNLNEDSARLAESSQRLVTYLDGAGDADAGLTSPQEEVETMMQAHGFHVPGIEDPGFDLAGYVRGRPELKTEAGRGLAERTLNRMALDSRALPLGRMAELIARHGADPSALVAETGVSPGTMLRRMAALPVEVLGGEIGFVACDSAGALIYRRPIEGFPQPRFSGACPKWPLFAALAQPNQPLLEIVEQGGRDPVQFECHAVAEPLGPVAFGERVLQYGFMVIRPVESRETGVVEVGVSCRICPRRGCAARREPSILAGEE